MILLIYFTESTMAVDLGLTSYVRRILTRLSLLTNSFTANKQPGGGHAEHTIIIILVCFIVEIQNWNNKSK